MLEVVDTGVLDLASRRRINDALLNATSDNTRRSYSSQWKQFVAWIEERGHVALLPISPVVVADYLTDRADTGAKIATIRSAATAISAAHRQADADNPVETEGVRKVLKGLARKLSVAAKQAKALDKEALTAIEATATLPRTGRGGRLESKATAAKRGNLDIALTRTASDAGLRRSEIASLKWENISENSDGSGLISIGRSKTDQEGQGTVLALSCVTMRSLNRIRPRDCDPSHKVFNLSSAQIHRRIRDAAIAAGLGEGYSGHSGRVGLAVRAAKNAAPTSAVMRMGRWKSAGMVARYSQAVSAAEDLRWLE